ncbi:hypothetical protein [Verrucomicrobium sp. BvORR106]|uniref:hypothetical protein n=1 Tax=Verrucomicrobium sp. BvORR106 TaxID=1403819 RepID=UPI0005703700|nr:hypothetical protein [Verrucomicrobium sp. BvORR106]
MKTAPRDSESLIASEIASLVVTFERVPEEHHLAMRSQMDALAGRLTHNQVWDAFDSAAEGENYSTHAAKDAALDAVEWLNGENPEAPSVRWLRVAKQRAVAV